MRGFSRFFGKELQEIARTWRLFVLPGIMLFFAVSGPILAKMTPELLASLTTSQPGVVIKLPEPTYVDAYVQWAKNLSQLVVFALLIVSGGIVAAERATGTAVLVLTKPVSRAGFVVAKFLAQSGLVVVATLVCTTVTWGVTLAVFGEAPPAKLFEAAGIWLAFAILLLSITLLLSCALSTIAAAGTAILVYFAILLASAWGPAVRWSPAGLVGAPSAVVLSKSVEVGWPLVTCVVVTGVFVLAAIAVFNRREL
jgi:ABC-2 type transport system permease protein